jgi:hypothetical protein
MGKRFPTRWPVLEAAAPAAIGVMLLITFVTAPSYRVDGFRRAADAMPYPADGALILVRN